MSSFQIVNGYVCLDCSDVALAQKGINPAHPPNSPSASTQSDGSPGAQGSSNAQSTPAVTFGGSLSQTQAAAAVQPSDGSTATATTFQPPPSQTGGQLNLYA
ncbi:MAG TPA: hypothetical protein VN805_07055 [Caulobacteraceae bacterium]|nr:hypothetical protein [Caulobacteraceae bacterium]